MTPHSICTYQLSSYNTFILYYPFLDLICCLFFFLYNIISCELPYLKSAMRNSSDCLFSCFLILCTSFNCQTMMNTFMYYGYYSTTQPKILFNIISTNFICCLFYSMEFFHHLIIDFY